METTCAETGITTLDGLLNHRVVLEQPADGFRAAIDTVLLAAAVPARADSSALDLGCGVGGALLCLAARVPGLRLAGVEIQPNLAELCRRNLARNGFVGEVTMGDIVEWRAAEPFDHILLNPPYHDEARHDVSAHVGKRIANSGQADDFKAWLAAAAAALKPGGSLTLIHRHDRLTGLLRDMAAYFGAIEILPLLPKTGAVPKRVILRGIKGAAAARCLCQPFILHRENGYTEEAEAILRHAQPLTFLPDTVSPQ